VPGPHPDAHLQRTLVVLVLGLGLIVDGGSGSGAAEPSDRKTGSYRAFTRKSYWNRPLGAAPADRISRERLRDLFTTNEGGGQNKFYVRLAGTENDPENWGEPIYWAGAGDRTYDVRYPMGEECYPERRPREFAAVPIPDGAEPALNSDGQMTIYHRAGGKVFQLREVRRLPTGRWVACGGAVYRLSSNGLHRKWRRCDPHPRNEGHRGLPPPTYAIRRGEILRGAIRHRLKMAVNRASPAAVFPMTASDGSGRVRIPEGAVLRIRRGIDLDRFLHGAALTVARALQRYGAVIGDQSGGHARIKVENPVAQGERWRWRTLAPRYRLTPHSLKRIRERWWQFVRLGWGEGRCGR
jgi:hypothetical protein